jgi:hypothetical protein
VRLDGVERAVRCDRVGQGAKDPNGSKLDRGPAGPVDFRGVRFDGVKQAVRVDGVVCLDSGGKILDRHQPGPVDVFFAIGPENTSTSPGPGRSIYEGFRGLLSFSRLATQPTGHWRPIFRPAPGQAGRCFFCHWTRK